MADGVLSGCGLLVAAGEEVWWVVVVRGRASWRGTYPWDVEEVEASVAEKVHCGVLADFETVFEVDLADVSAPRCWGG